MSNETDRPVSSRGSENNSANTAHPRRGVSRRQLLKGGAAAAPVIMTVTSRPALAAWCTPSTFDSANLSKVEEACDCLSPGWYVTHYGPGDWPDIGSGHFTPGNCMDPKGGRCKEFDGTGTQWDDFLPGGWVPYSGLSFGNVLALHQGSIGWYLVAHLMNTYRDDIQCPLTTDLILDIANQLSTYGVYSPPSGGDMTEGEIKEFFKNTQGKLT